MAQAVTWSKKSRKRAELIRCGLSITRWTSSQRISPSNSAASPCCSCNVFICFSAFHVQFHGQITVNSVVIPHHRSAWSLSALRNGRSIIVRFKRIYHYLAQRQHLPSLEARFNHLFRCYFLEVGYENCYQTAVLWVVPGSDVAGWTIWACTGDLRIVIWHGSRQHWRGRSKRQGDGYRRQQGNSDHRPEQWRGVLAGRQPDSRYLYGPGRGRSICARPCGRCGASRRNLPESGYLPADPGLTTIR